MDARRLSRNLLAVAPAVIASNGQALFYSSFPHGTSGLPVYQRRFSISPAHI